MAHHGFHYSDLAETEVTESKVRKIKFRIYIKTNSRYTFNAVATNLQKRPKDKETHKSQNRKNHKTKLEIAISGQTQN